jgi:predicted transcriptional regulator
MIVADAQEALIMLGHPLRREILKQFVEQAEPLSPDRVAKELGERLSNVSYHVRVLADAGALMLIDEHPAHGSVQHFYVHNEAVTGQSWVREALGLPKLP